MLVSFIRRLVLKGFFRFEGLVWENIKLWSAQFGILSLMADFLEWKWLWPTEETMRMALLGRKRKSLMISPVSSFLCLE